MFPNISQIHTCQPHSNGAREKCEHLPSVWNCFIRPSSGEIFSTPNGMWSFICTLNMKISKTGLARCSHGNSDMLGVCSACYRLQFEFKGCQWHLLPWSCHVCSLWYGKLPATYSHDGVVSVTSLLVLTVNPWNTVTTSWEVSPVLLNPSIPLYLC